MPEPQDEPKPKAKPKPEAPLKDDAASGTGPAPSCTLVIFGAGGDLTKRLLMPSLYNLAGAGLLPDGFAILGVDHNDNTDEGLRQDLTEAMDAFSKDPGSEFHADRIDPASWGFVRDRIRFLRGISRTRRPSRRSRAGSRAARCSTSRSPPASSAASSTASGRAAC